MELKIPLHKAQREIFSNKKRFNILVAGRRFGKTTLLGFILLLNSLQIVGIHAYIAPSYRMAKRIAWDKFKKAIPKNLITKINESELTIELLNGSKLMLFGSDNPDSLRGIGFSSVCIDEYDFCPNNLWDAVVRPALTESRGSAWFVGTPDSFGKLYTMMKDYEQNEDWKYFHYTSLDNPFLSKEEIQNAKSTMDPRLFRQEYLASYEAPTNIVYEDFSRELNVETCSYNPNLPVLIGMDFNITPFVALVGQYIKDKLFIIDEITLNNAHTKMMADEIIKRYGNTNVEIWCDASGNQRKTSAIGVTDVDILRTAGFNVKFKYIHSQADKYNAVRAFLLNANNQRRLIIDPNCKKLINNLQTLDYKSDNDHWCDALAYLIYGKFNPVREELFKQRELEYKKDLYENYHNI